MNITMETIKKILFAKSKKDLTQEERTLAIRLLVVGGGVMGALISGIILWFGAVPFLTLPIVIVIGTFYFGLLIKLVAVFRRAGNIAKEEQKEIDQEPKLKEKPHWWEANLGLKGLLIFLFLLFAVPILIIILFG